MEEYKKLEVARVKCFRRCEEHNGRPLPKNFPEDSDLRFFYNVIARGSCIKECEEMEMGLRPWGGVSHQVFKQLKSKEGLNYLQMALYKVGQGEGEVCRRRPYSLPIQTGGVS